MEKLIPKRVPRNWKQLLLRFRIQREREREDDKYQRSNRLFTHMENKRQPFKKIKKLRKSLKRKEASFDATMQTLLSKDYRMDVL